MSKSIGLLGGTGGVGTHLLKYLLDGGHSVRVLVRNPDKLKDLKEHPKLEVLTGSSTNEDDVKKLCDGMDIVASCLGNVKNGPLIMASSADNLMNASPNKLIAISSLGMGGSSGAVKFTLRCIVGKRQVEDYEKADKILLDNKACPTIIVRPNVLSDNPGTGKYKATKETGMSLGSITRQDVALFIYDKIQEGWDATEAIQLYRQK